MNRFFFGLGIFLFLRIGTHSYAQSQEQKLDDLLGIQPESSQLTPSSEGKSKESADLDKLLNTDSSTTQKKKNPLIEAFEKAKRTFSATSYGFASNKPTPLPGDDPKSWFNYGRLSMDTWLSVNNDFDIKIDFLLQHGSEENEYHLQQPFQLDRDLRSRNVDFEQLYLKKKVGDSDFVLGKQRIDLGMNSLYSPMDRLSPWDANHPQDPKKLGVYQAVWTYYHQNSATEFHYLPFFQESKPPPPTSRWATSDATSAVASSADGVSANQLSNFQFPGVNLQGLSVAPGTAVSSISNNSAVEDISNRLDHPNFLLREKLVLGSFDWVSNLYYGYLPNNSLLRDGLFVRKTHTRGWWPSIGTSTVVGKFELHGEMLAQIPENRSEDTFANPAIGIEYDLNNLFESEAIQSAKFILEYAYELVIEEQNNEKFPIRTDRIRPGRNSFFAYWNLEITDQHRTYYGMTFNVRDQDYSQKVGYEYKCADGLSFEINYQWFDGPYDTLFGQWRNNNIVTVQCVKKF